MKNMGEYTLGYPVFILAHLVHFLFHEFIFFAAREFLWRSICYLELATLLFRDAKLRFRLPWPGLVCLIRFHRGMQLIQYSKNFLVRLITYFTALKSIIRLLFLMILITRILYFDFGLDSAVTYKTYKK